MTAFGKLKGSGKEGNQCQNEIPYKEVNAMKDLTQHQVETLLDMVLFKDCYGVKMEKENLGRFTPKVDINDISEESMLRLGLAATIVHMSRFSAKDIDLLSQNGGE